ncbi:polyprenol monophosphomannose synthase [Bombella favorum]|uniref:Dolichol-phosphate mannosyltransferase n=1 Tax=Bombella favorum TaxID=2039164 RepID=A0ABR5ZP72_9PROT|nr:polyprenol monophosphomannose synthase [Bombella favorum]MBA5726137.1 dolichol-phosphate mannosyltransferase [Bombella favorum]
MTAPEISIIIPCYNEVKNVVPLVNALETVLNGMAWEVVFVDDNSPDGTMDAVRQLAQQKPYVRGLLRIGRRGLSSAVIEGALSVSAPLIAVMDGDLQHDESCLHAMIAALRDDQADIAVASRHVAGGSNEGLSNGWRRFLSNSGIWAARQLLNVPLTDPMSGFFAIKRSVFTDRAAQLDGKGFKILLDIMIARSKPLRVKEVPMAFRDRAHGESKLDSGVMISFAQMLAKHSFRRRPVPTYSAATLVGGGLLWSAWRLLSRKRSG